MMRAFRTFVVRTRGVLGDNLGTMAIETALVAPLLLLMSLGSFEVSRMVARQHELQSGIAEAEAVALAANMGAETQTTEVANILRDSLDLQGEQVTVVKRYRCNDSSTLVTSEENCDEDDVISSYMLVNVRDNFAPMWKHFGVKKSFRFKVDRQVQLS